MEEKRKVGRPTKSRKDYMLRVKMDKETLAALNTCCEKTQLNRSEFVRKSIMEKYEILKWD